MQLETRFGSEKHFQACFNGSGFHVLESLQLEGQRPLRFILGVSGLQCYVGLGNASKRNEMKVVECPEGKFYVCVKMFGGGMGDQIRRYCEAIPREVNYQLCFYLQTPNFADCQDYKDLQEKEELKETEFPMVDPACYDTVHNGREVKVCICTGDKCNGGETRYPARVWMICMLFMMMASY